VIWITTTFKITKIILHVSLQMVIHILDMYCIMLTISFSLQELSWS